MVTNSAATIQKRLLITYLRYTLHFQTNNDFKTYFDTEKNKLKEGITRWKEASETEVNKQFQALNQVWTFHLKHYEYKFTAA